MITETDIRSTEPSSLGDQGSGDVDSSATGRGHRGFERFYSIAVAIKGFDGAIELLVGLLLAVFPALPNSTLVDATRAASDWGTPLGHLLSAYTEGLDDQLTAGAIAFLAVLLIAHGVIKIALVVCLLKRWYRGYPAAIAILLGFLAYQVYFSIVTPTFTIIALAVLDAAIVLVVAREYLHLRAARRPALEEYVGVP